MIKLLGSVNFPQHLFFYNFFTKILLIKKTRPQSNFEHTTKINCFFDNFWKISVFEYMLGTNSICYQRPKGDTLNYTEKFLGIYTVGWKYRRKTPNSVGKRPTVSIILRPRPQFFHNFVSFHLILMFLTILESGDKTKNIENEFKTIWLI
jgi:hypothetical protein